MPHRWQAPGESRWHKDHKTANSIQAQNNVGPFQQWLEWILPYFCFWSDRMRLKEASTVMIQLDVNSQDIYYSHHFYARCTSYCKSSNLSWLEIGKELCWTANPITLFAGIYYESCLRSHCISASLSLPQHITEKHTLQSPTYIGNYTCTWKTKAYWHHAAKSVKIYL